MKSRAIVPPLPRDAAGSHASPESVWRALHAIHDDRLWSNDADTLSVLSVWVDGHPLTLHEKWSDRRSLSPNRYHSTKKSFLHRVCHGLRWQRLAVLLAAVVLLGAAPSFAQAPQDHAKTFAQANAMAQEGRWELAAEGYRKLVAQGVNDAAVWYDLGNAYVELDDLGRARACYERAVRLTPRDADLRANLAVLKKKLADREPDDVALMLIARQFTMNELAVATSALWFITAALFVLWLRRRREAPAWLAALSLGLLLGVGGLFSLLVNAEYDGRQAVVIPTEVKLYNGPGRDYTNSITLHAGARVQVLRSEGDWREVGALNTVRGWLRAEELETI